MKMAALLLGVAMACPLTLLAAPPLKGSMLISGHEITTVARFPLISLATGDARALIGDFRVSAREIVFDQSNNRLTCREVKSISSGYAAPDAKDVILTVQADNVYFLNPTGIVLEPRAQDRPAPGRIFDHPRPELAQPAPRPEPFSGTIPKLELNLSSRPQP